jgi:glycosyltransferase involved in cell wall biosynthesis
MGSPRVAIFVPSMRGGGAERVMATLANSWVELGLEVDVVLVERVGPYLASLDPRVRIVDLRVSRVAHAVWPLVRYLRERRPRALLAAMVHANVAAIIARVLANTGTRLVVSERIDPAQSRHRWSLYLRRWLYPRADRIIAVSEGTAATLRRLLPGSSERVVVVYNPIDVGDAARAATEPTGHPWLTPGVPDLPVVVAAGRLTPQKGFDILLRAFARVNAERSTRLIILGEGPQRPALIALAEALGIAERVDLPGFVSNPFAFFGRAALFVLSSRREGLPNVLLQALACGAPVVSSDCASGPGEILEGGKWGALVPVGDATALADAMLAALGAAHHPDGRVRAADFAIEPLALAYLRELGIEGPFSSTRLA